MGQIKHYNNGKWTIYTSGEGLSGYTGVTNTYYVGPDLNNDGNLTKANPDGSLVNLEINLTLKTWSEMLALSNNNSLIQGQHYLITDFQTNAIILNTGEVEYGSPYGTLWNIDGWADLSDYTTRTYVDWATAIGYAPPDYVGTEAIMFDLINNKYYKIMFSQWTGGGAGGGFAYTRTEILSPTTFGTPVNFTHTNYGTEVDYIDEGLAITRGVNKGIFNIAYENSYSVGGYFLGGEYTVGSVEPLIVQAVSNNSISNQVLSTIYPEDEILYGLKDLIQGATKGRIQFRKDTKLVISTYYDWRVVKFRRWFDTVVNGYISLVDNGQVFEDYLTFPNQNGFTTEIPLLNNENYPQLNNTVFLDYCANNYIKVVDFRDNTFDNFSSNYIISNSFYDNYGGIFIQNKIYSTSFTENKTVQWGVGDFSLNLIVGNSFQNNSFNLFRGNEINSEVFAFTSPIVGGSGNFLENKLNIKSCQNTTYSYFSRNNVFSNDFSSNQLNGSFVLNNINAVLFVSNVINGGFDYNDISGSVINFNSNQISGGFSQNNISASILNCIMISGNFINNIINSTMQSCIVQNGFRENTINTPLLSLNLSTPANLYEPAYTKTIFANRDGQVFLTYLNNTNTPVYVSVP